MNALAVLLLALASSSAQDNQQCCYGTSPHLIHHLVGCVTPALSHHTCTPCPSVHELQIVPSQCFPVLPSLPLLVSFIGPYLFTYRGHALQRLNRSLTHEHPPTHTSLASPLPLIPVRAHRHDPGRLPRRPPLRRQVWQRPEVPVQCRRVQEL